MNTISESSPSSDLITLEEMRGAIKRAVEERGEGFVYEHKPWPDSPNNIGCHYNHPVTGEPDCLIGLAYSYLRPNHRLPSQGSAPYVLQCEATASACGYAQIAQIKQDDGETWGEALAAAEAWLAERERV